MSPNNRTMLRALAQLLREDHKKNLREAADNEDSDLEGEDSLDAQIDKFFVNYESEAKNLQQEGLDFRMLTRRILMEEDEEEESSEADEDEADSESSEESDEGSDEEPEKLTSEDINVQSFVTDVMRLVDNYDSLLEVKNTILRRAAKYLEKSYDEQTVELFKEELLESYGLEIGVSKTEREDSLEFQPPKAAAAGPMGGSA